jgi:hypothetical protein
VYVISNKDAKITKTENDLIHTELIAIICTFIVIIILLMFVLRKKMSWFSRREMERKNKN